MAAPSWGIGIKRFFSYRFRKFLQRFLAALLASLFINFVPGFFSPVPALVEDAPSYTKPVLQILKEGLVTTAEEAEADPELLPVLDNPFVIVGLVAINVGVAWYFYSQAQQQAAQQLAQQKYYQAYCHVFKSDPLCGPVFDLSYYSPNNRGWITWRIGQGQGFLDWKIEECIWDYGGGQGPQDEGPAMITQTADGVWSDEKSGGTCNGPGVDPKTVTITPVNAQWPAWKDWPQEQRNQAVGLLTDDDWISNLQQSPQGGVFQQDDQLPKGYFAFPPDGPPQYIPGPADVPDGPPGPIPNPSPSGVPGSSPPPDPSPSPSPSDSPSPSPDPSPSSSPPTASGGGDSGSSPAPSGGSQPSDDDMWRELDRLNNPTPEVSQEAQAIANGHAWNDHHLEFPEVHSQDEFARLIDGVINNASEEKQLSNGRTAYWDAQSTTVVIRDPGDVDGGTAFRPTGGKDYFDNLK